MILTENKRTTPINGNIREMIFLTHNCRQMYLNGSFDMNDFSKIFSHYLMLWNFRNKQKMWYLQLLDIVWYIYIYIEYIVYIYNTCIYMVNSEWKYLPSQCIICFNIEIWITSLICYDHTIYMVNHICQI